MFHVSMCCAVQHWTIQAQFVSVLNHRNHYSTEETWALLYSSQFIVHNTQAAQYSHIISLPAPYSLHRYARKGQSSAQLKVLRCCPTIDPPSYISSWYNFSEISVIPELFILYSKCRIINQEENEVEEEMSERCALFPGKEISGYQRNRQSSR